MRKTADRIVLSALALLGAGAPALAATKLLEKIPLVWKPTDLKSVGIVNLSGIADVKIQVEPLIDSRADKAKFGENQEDKTPKPVTTSGNVAEFCAQHLAETLKQFGFSVVAQGGDFVIGGEILEFMVTETNNYKGEVRLKLNLKKGGQAEWTGVTAGDSKRFGRSYKPDNYYETISDALLRAVGNLARDEGFRKALGGK